MTELFERDCPYYLSIGMTYDQYWYGDPLMVRTFYKAHKLKEQLADQQAWLQGQYVMAAIGAQRRWMAGISLLDSGMRISFVLDDGSSSRYSSPASMA